MNILLVQAPMPQNLMMKEIINFGLRNMPLQLAYMASVLRENGYDVHILDLHVMQATPEIFAQRYLSAVYDVVGISCTTVSFNGAIEITKLIKKVHPKIKTILGGPHVTFRSRQVLEENGGVDYIVRGEGEYTLLELIQALDKGMSLDKVAGLCYRDGKDIVSNPERHPLQNLDLLPFPARDLLLKEEYPTEGIVTSRGCPRKCIFCAAGAMSNYTYRIRSPQNIIRELSLLQGERVISFYDNTFSGRYELTLLICKAIIAADLKIQWTCELRADRATPELFKLLYTAGCRGVQFGVESGSDVILRSVKKGITTEQVRSAVDMAVEAGLKVVCSFTIGHPSDTKETIQETFNFMQELRKKGATVSSALLVPYPGTALCEQAEELGVHIYDENWDTYYPARPIISTKNLTREDLGKYYLYSKLIIEDPHFVNLRLSS